MDQHQCLRLLAPLSASFVCLLLMLSCDDNDGSDVDQGSDPLTMIIVPAGDFMMGQADVAEPEHHVTLTHDFLLGKTEVTNQQYRDGLQWAFDQGMITASSVTVTAYGVELIDLEHPECEIAFNAGVFSLEPIYGAPYVGRSCADHPVLLVSWYGAACFCDWISLMNNLEPYYEGQWTQIPSLRNPYTATGYRLPTEAEWEFAAQYDDERTYPWGLNLPTCDFTNYNYGEEDFAGCVGWTSPVGSHPAGANALGLQDMAGNLWEWCNDWYADYSPGAVTDPVGPLVQSGIGRVERGGSWDGYANYLACASRDFGGNDFHGGFRLCKTR